MATAHSAEAYGHHGHDGNGLNGHAQETREWLGIPKEHTVITCYSLLGITADEANNPQRLNDAELDRLAILAPHLQEERTRAIAEAIAKAIGQAKELLSDPARRAKYDKAILVKHPELTTALRASTTHDAVATTVPAVVVAESDPSPWKRKRSSKYGDWRIHAGIVVGVTAAAAGVLSLLRSNTNSSPPVTPANAKLTLPEDAPELAQVPPVSPTPVPPAADGQTLRPPVAPSAPPTPAVVQPPKPAKKPEPLAAAPAPATPPVPPEEPDASDQTPIAKRLSVPADPIDPDLLRSPKFEKETVESLIAKSRQAKDAKDQWFLLQIALQKAEGHLDRIAEVIREIQSRFDANQQSNNIWVKAVLNAARQKSNVVHVMPHAAQVAWSLCADGRFDDAATFLTMLQSRPGAEKKGCLDLRRTVDQVKQAHAQGTDAFACLVLGDWSDTGPLHDSEDGKLHSLGERLDGRDTLSSEQLLQLARDLVSARSPAAAGTVAVALELLSLADEKTDSHMLKAQIGILQADLADRPQSGFAPSVRGLALRPMPVQDPIAKQNPASGIQPQTAAIQPLDSRMLPTGGVTLFSGSPDALMGRSSVVRSSWKALERNGTTALECESGHHEWISFVHVPVSQEGLDIVQSGKPYVFSSVFTRSPKGRNQHNALQGGVAFLVPLPTKRHAAVLWDGNVHGDFAKRGLFRSGLCTNFEDIFQHQGFTSPPSTWRRQDTQPLIKEDGQEYLFHCTVQPQGPLIHITAHLCRKANNMPIASVSLPAPSTIDASPYYLKEGKNGVPPVHPVIGFGGGGGTVTFVDAFIAPMPQKKDRQPIGGRTQRK